MRCRLFGGIGLTVLLGVALCVSGVAAGPTSVPCTPVWLNSTSQATLANGTYFTAWPIMPDGQLFQGASGGLTVLDFYEMPSVPGVHGPKCPVSVQDQNITYAATEAVRKLGLASCNCQMTTGRRLVANGLTSASFVDYFYTRPDWPDFQLTLTLELADVFVQETLPMSNYTYGMNVTETWEVSAPKQSISLQNWNWTDSNASSSSISMFFELSGMYFLLSGQPIYPIRSQY